jgi:hypothetical protein
MKYIIRTFSVALLVVTTFILTNCGKDDAEPLTEQQEATKELTATWGSPQIISSPVAGADGTLEDLTLTFGATADFQPGSFSASGAPDYFTSTGSSTWTWGNAGSSTEISLLNVTPVQALTVEELTATTLTVSFQFDNTNGRTNGIGEYRLLLTRQ